MPAQNRKNNGPITIVRRLREPEHPCIRAQLESTYVPLLKVVSAHLEPRGVASLDESHQFVSSSFNSILEDFLPLKGNRSTRATFGGVWFWEGYRHALYGEDIIYCLGGTGINLAEDTIASQKEVRNKVTVDEKPCGLLSNSLHSSQQLWLHSSAKLEVMYATALSVSLHVSQQPLLDRYKGPQALVLCATKDQCDEVSFILNQYCSELHLIVHNLFEPFPSMPLENRADIVVGTPPLWESVAQLGKWQDRMGLEAILSVIRGGAPPPTYASTKWRPYTTGNISQLVLFDFDLQVNSGFGSMLLHLLSPPDSTVAPVYTLPSRCQIYTVLGENRAVCEIDNYSALLKLVRLRTIRCREGIAEISLPGLTWPSLLRKRTRSEEVTAPPTTPPVYRPLASGLLIKNALSFSRLLADGRAFQDLADGLLERAAAFWGGFDALPAAVATAAPVEVLCSSQSDLQHHLKCELVFLCVPTEGDELRVQEVCALLLPRYHEEEAAPCPRADKTSRQSLLFRHLEEELNGELFDGSPLSCVNLEDYLFSDYLYELISSGEEQVAAKVNLFDNYFCALGTGRIVVATRAGSNKAAYLQEVNRITALRTNSWALSVSNVEASNDALKLECDVSLCIPPHAFVPLTQVTHPFTVVALRNLAVSRDALWQGNSSLPAEAEGRLCRKPLTLSLLEECCQYGRVVSYYCFEQDAVRRDSVNNCMPLSKDKIEKDKLTPEEGVHDCVAAGTNGMADDCFSSPHMSPTAAALFIEFESHASALEATRLLRLRFECHPGSREAETSPLNVRVHLFRSATYYAGIEQEFKKLKALQAEKGGCETDDDVFDFSLLAE